jgi:acyl-CoA hydrolase
MSSVSTVSGLIVFADGPDGPLPDPAVVSDIAGIDPAIAHLVTGWVVREPHWLKTTSVPVTTLMLGSGMRSGADSGLVRAVPTRLSALPGLLEGRLRPEVAVVGGYETNNGGWALAGSPGMALASVRHAARVVIERWPGRPPPGVPPLPIQSPKLVEVIDRTDPPDPLPTNRIADTHVNIGRFVAQLIPDQATVQWGPGVVGASVITALQTPVRVRSGLVTDEVSDLARRGLLVGAAEAADAWGGSALHDMIRTGDVVLREIDYTHDLTAISRIEQFVAINTALQVGLDGSANVEMVGGRVVSGPGGHPDFATGASRSPNGVSIVALVSTKDGRSTIVARPDAVSTPHIDVDVVVTEHGIADLRHCDRRARADRLIAISDPAHQEELGIALGG